MSQWVYNSAQVAQILGVSGGMVRRYALTLEELTGEKVPQHPRDGRRFSQEHVDALIAARRFVAGHKGMSVEEGLRRALGMADESSAAPLPRSLPVTSLDTVEALSEALRQYSEPLLTQLRTLGESNKQLVDSNRQLSKSHVQLAAEVEALRSELAETKALPPGATPEGIDRALEVEMRAENIELGVDGQRPYVESMGSVAERVARTDDDGMLVRLARRLERLLGRGT